MERTQDLAVYIGHVDSSDLPFIGLVVLVMVGFVAAVGAVRAWGRRRANR